MQLGLGFVFVGYSKRVRIGESPKGLGFESEKTCYWDSVLLVIQRGLGLELVYKG